MILQNERLRLRAVEPNDLTILYKWENDASLWNYGNTVSPISGHTLTEFINNAPTDIYEHKQLRLIITLNEENRPVGTVDLFDFEPRHRRCGIGILVDREYRQDSIATEAIELIIDYCFDFLNLKQIYAYIPESNEPSMKLFKRNGFVVSGICKEWIAVGRHFEDVLFLQRINDR